MLERYLPKAIRASLRMIRQTAIGFFKGDNVSGREISDDPHACMCWRCAAFRDAGVSFHHSNDFGRP